MPTCLTPDEFVDLIDGTLPPARRAHVDACERCRTTADEVRQAWQAATAIEVPEPSALFWPSINARVRAAITSPDGARAQTWWRWPVLVPVAALAAIVLALAVTLPRQDRVADPDVADAQAVPAAVPDAVPAAGEAGIAPLDDASLALMIDLAGELPDGAWGALGVGTLPELDVAAAVLTDDERRALEALLQAEVSQPKS